MTVVNFAYDGDIIQHREERNCHNIYDKKYYPINGIWEDCYYDYHAPIQIVLERNGVNTKSITMHEALSCQEPFVYVLTFRYIRLIIDNSHDERFKLKIPKNYNFFEHLPIGLIHAVNSGRCLLLLNGAVESNTYDEYFFQKLKEKLSKVFTDFSNIVIISGNVDNKKIDTDIKVIFWQYFETAMRLCLEHSNQHQTQHQYSDSVKKFLCLNARPREFRYFFMFQMYNKGILSEFNASLKGLESLNELKVINSGHDFLSQIEDVPEFQTMLKTLPWTIDTDDFGSNHWNNVDYPFKMNNLIFITTETLFGDGTTTLFITEKTFKPIMLKMPFIVLGDSLILRHLRMLGYKTFCSMWDESYDEEHNVNARMNKIVKLVNYISNKYTILELQNLIDENKDILDHNYNLLLTRRPELELINTIKNRS